MPSLPVGIVTFLFTDIEGSTKIWEEYPVNMQEALRQHDEILSTIFFEHGGVVVKQRGEGDSFFVVFSIPSDAVRAACLVQEKLAKTEWPVPQSLRVRMALHSGEAEFRDGDYYGTTVNRCARLRAIAHGGQVVLSEVTAQLANGNLPSEITLLDLGSHRLKDLSTPEQVFQLIYPGLTEGFPPLRSLHSRQHNLPVQATSFIGRESELKELHTRLRQTRLLSLLGPGGTGKTRLSLQLAAESAEDFPDGVWLAELAPLQDHGLLYQTVASIFGIKEQNHLSLQEVLTNHLQSKQMCLVLDNCEHLIEQCAMLAANVIQKCPGVKMVVTSREPLNITGETIWRVPSLLLPNPDDHLSIEHLLKYEAVRLFVDRALSVQHSFTVSAQNASAIADICHRLDGIPLALELAAARVKSLTVEQIAQRLSESFRLLIGGDRTKLPRQQTLRALIDWSYDLLNESERIMWRRLSVFAGSIRLEAAEAICSGEGVDEFEVIDLLSQLVDKSLVISEEREGEVRYRLLTTIRQHGQEKLNEAGERDIVLEKHCDYYLAFIEKTAAGLRSPHMQAATVQEWAREIDNLRIAMDWSQQLATINPLFVDKAGRLISASPFFWPILGLVREGYTRLQVWLALPNCSAQTYIRAGVLLVAGNFSADTDLKQANLYIQESIEIARKLGDSRTLAKGLSFMGYAYNLTGQFQEAIEFMDEAYAILQEAKLDWETTELLRLKGFVLLKKQDLAGVKATAEQNLKLCRQLGNTHEEAATLRTFGILAVLDRQVFEAKRYFQESLAITCELGDKQCTHHGLGGISLVAEVCNEKELAAWLGGAFESFSETNGYGVGMYISPTANEIWTALKADLPEIWAYGRKASYDETVSQAISFVAEMK
jgi:predicted ATPase/class 3 adenylate cyclase